MAANTSTVETNVSKIESQIQSSTEERSETTTINMSTENEIHQVKKVVESRRIIVDMNGKNANLMTTESHENPFTSDGELSKKAEYILRHSTISRSEIRISDPDLSKSSLERSDLPNEESPLVPQQAMVNACSPEEMKLKENGKLEGQALTPDTVQVEVATANASQPQPQQAEQVKLKEPKCKCCVVM